MCLNYAVNSVLYLSLNSHLFYNFANQSSFKSPKEQVSIAMNYNLKVQDIRVSPFLEICFSSLLH